MPCVLVIASPCERTEVSACQLPRPAVGRRDVGGFLYVESLPNGRHYPIGGVKARDAGLLVVRESSIIVERRQIVADPEFREAIGGLQVRVERRGRPGGELGVEPENRTRSPTSRPSLNARSHSTSASSSSVFQVQK